MAASGKYGTFSVGEIMSWSVTRIRYEIEDQERWIREGRQDGMTSSDMEAAIEFLNNLKRALASK